MNIIEAKIALKDGYKVCHIEFNRDEYLYQKDGSIYDQSGKEIGAFFWEHRRQLGWNENWFTVDEGIEDIFEKDYLESIGFKTVKDDGVFGEASSIKPRGMTIINWNREGHHCTYFGDKLEKNVSVGIRKDAGTRTAFSGYVFNREQLELLIKLTL